MDELLRSRIHRLIRDSKDVLHRANEYVARDGKPVPETDMLEEEERRILGKEWEGLIGDNFGTVINFITVKYPETYAEKAWNVLWDLTKACIYVQHGGLARETQVAPLDFVEVIFQKFTPEHAKAQAKLFFKSDDDTKRVDSAFYCGAYAEAFHRAAKSERVPEPSSNNLRSFAESRAKHASDILKKLNLSESTTDPPTPWDKDFSEVITFYYHEKAPALKAVRAVSIWKHLKRLETTTGWDLDLPEVNEDQVNEALLGLLERAGAQDTPNAPPLLLTLAARALAGRYPNGSWPPSHRWRRALSLTVEHVLERQGGQAEADWGLPDAFDIERNPTATQYLPLLHVLDLPEPVLIDTSERVVAACEVAIAEVSVRLDDVDRMLRSDQLRSDHWWKSPSKASRFYRNVVAGMAVGAAVYERARDILSEAVLDDLEATVPHVKGKESIESRAPKCLGFRQSVMEGVIKPWAKWRDNRPGAILMFGPPGTGKTSNVRLIAARLDKETENDMGQWRFLSVSPADFVREGRDKIVGSAEKLFGRLMDVRRCVVLMDEMEEFLRDRGGSDVDRDARLITTAFLPLLQEISERREIVLIVATNFVGSIDPAVLRPGRFDMILPLGPMGNDGRVKTILQILEGKYETVQGFINLLEVLKTKYEPKKDWVEAVLKIPKKIDHAILQFLKTTDKEVQKILKAKYESDNDRVEAIRTILKTINDKTLQFFMKTDEEVQKILKANYEDIDDFIEFLKILKTKYEPKKDRVEAILTILKTIDDAALKILKTNYATDKDLDDAVLKILKAKYATDKDLLDGAVLKILKVLTQLVRYTQGCTFIEIKALIDEDEEVKKEIRGLIQTKEDHFSLPNLVRKLWMVRVKKPPTALLGQAGASWESFREEVNRFSRLAPKVKYEPDESYWQRPAFPDYESRRGDSM